MAVGIYFCGEVVADMIEQKEGSGEFQFSLGGSHFNEVMGAARELDRQKINCKIAFVGAISTDMFGERFFKKLEEKGTDTTNAWRVPYNTTMATVSVRPGQENGFTFYWRHTSVQIKPEDVPASLGAPNESKICCFGSISTVIEPGRLAWLESAKKQRDQAIVFYDLNARPSIAKDPELYRSIVAEWARVAHVMKGSDADIAWAYPGLSMQEVATLWLNEGATLAVFTKGMHGSEAYMRNNIHASAETLDLVANNTVGAGDNFNAGFAIALVQLGCVTSQSVMALTEAQLGKILQSANNTAAYHLIANGAQPRAVRAAS